MQMQESQDIQPLPYYQPKYLKLTNDPKNPVISTFDPAPMLAQLDVFLKNFQIQQYDHEHQTIQLECLKNKTPLKLMPVENYQNPKNLPFQDAEFPPVHKSQGPDQNNYEWKRVSEFIRNPQVFINEISPTDIRQGDLGDCYFLSALASLAEWKNTILNLFQTRQNNKGGYYVAKICWKGVFQNVIIDDFFPVENDFPVYSRCDGDEIWVLIIEKMWAKLHGNYAHIDGGLAREPLHDLTGAPSRTYRPKVGGSSDHPTNHYIWDRIKDGELRDHAMCAGTILYEDGSNACKYLEKNLGLITGHIYTLIANYKLELGKGYKEKVVKLRNPWGDHEWKGRLSDNDPLWDKVDQQIKDSIGYSKSADDGIFFMVYDDFLNSFDDVTICYQYPQNNFAYEGVPFTISDQKKFVMYEVQIEKPGIYFFQTCQRSVRTQPLNIQNDPKIGNNFYSSIIMTVGNQGGKSDDEYFQFRVQGNRREVLSWNYVEQPYEIPDGRYLVYIQVIESNYQTDDKTYGFGVYGSSQVKIKELQQLTSDLEQFRNFSLEQLDKDNFEMII